MSEVILEVKNLKKYFPTPAGTVQAVDNVSFSIKKGKTIGIVGESGCGKSTTGMLIAKLLEETSGEIYFEGRNILDFNKKETKKLREDIQLIFQDPFSSLNPKRTLSQTLEEALIIHKKYKSKSKRKARLLELMKLVGLSEHLINSYPHELDGGRRQRIGIARALALNPKLIVCDEPVSALDVSIQAQILNLLKELQRNHDLTYIFITHDLSVVRHFSDEIAVMYLGQIVEKAPAKDLFKNPTHPYTKALLSAIPIPKLNLDRKRIILKGEISSPINLKPGCRFAPRCVNATEICIQKDPSLEVYDVNHYVACFNIGDKDE